MIDSRWVRWSQWTQQGMVGTGMMKVQEMQERLQQFEVKAREMLVNTDADHVLYGRKLYNGDGKLKELRFYMLPMSDEEFEERVAPLKNQQVYAVHKLK